MIIVQLKHLGKFTKLGSGVRRESNHLDVSDCDEFEVLKVTPFNDVKSSITVNSSRLPRARCFYLKVKFII